MTDTRILSSSFKDGVTTAIVTSDSAKHAFNEAKTLGGLMGKMSRYLIINPNREMSLESAQELIKSKSYNRVKCRSQTMYCMSLLSGDYLFVCDETSYNKKAVTFAEKVFSHKKFNWALGMEFSNPDQPGVLSYTVKSLVASGSTTKQVVASSSGRAEIFLQHELLRCKMVDSEKTAHALRLYIRNLYKKNYTLAKDEDNGEFLLIASNRLIGVSDSPTELIAEKLLECLEEG